MAWAASMPSLAGAPPCRGLDLRGVPHASEAGFGLDHHLDREPPGVALEGIQQALVGEDGRMDRVRELPQAGHEGAEVALELLERVARPRVAAAQAFPGHRELREAHHQILLDAVVQVALDPLPFGVLGARQPGP
jgi:hypothetical protein